MSGAVLKADARNLIRIYAPKLFVISLLYLLLLSGLLWLYLNLPGTIDFQAANQRIAAGEIPNASMIYKEFRPAGVVIALILSLIRPAAGLIYKKRCLKLKRGGQAGYKDISISFECCIKCFVIFFVTLFFILLWSLLLIIPGIVAAYRYRLAYYILLDDPAKGALQCIDESAVMMRGGKLDLFIIDLSFLGWYIIDATVVYFSPVPFTPRIMLIWILPYTGLTYAGFYEYQMSILTV